MRFAESLWTTRPAYCLSGFEATDRQPFACASIAACRIRRKRGWFALQTANAHIAPSLAICQGKQPSMARKGPADGSGRRLSLPCVVTLGGSAVQLQCVATPTSRVDAPPRRFATADGSVYTVAEEA